MTNSSNATTTTATTPAATIPNTNTTVSDTTSTSSPSSSTAALHSPLQHQSKSFPPRLQRTPSISSQSSIDSTPTRQSVS